MSEQETNRQVIDDLRHEKLVEVNEINSFY